MKSRLATGFTLLALVGGSGGALAVAGSSTGGAGLKHSSAAATQYTPSKKSKKCKKGFHKVGNHCVRTKTVIKKKPTPKRLTGPAFTGARDHNATRR